MPGLVTLGESLGLLTTEGIGPLRYAKRLELGFGGAESNVAIGVRRLGHEATWIGRVGADEFGRLIVGGLRGEDVRALAAIDPVAPTALMFKERRAEGRTRVTYRRQGSAGARLSSADLDLAAIGAAEVLHVTGITPALSASARDAVRVAVQHARAQGVTVSYNMNYRAALGTPDSARDAALDRIADVDLIFLNEAELAIMVPGCTDLVAAARAVRDLGPAEVIVTCGTRGAFVLAGSDTLESPAIPAFAVDAVGAGDGFAAGYLSVLLDGGDAAARLSRGCECGALCVMSVGDWEGMPDQSDLQLFRDDIGSVIRLPLNGHEHPVRRISMKITGVDAWTVAVPFRNPIQSAYGVSFPARIRVIVRVRTDEGLEGIGETGPSAVSTIDQDDLAPRFLRDIAPRVIGGDPFRVDDLIRASGYAPDCVAVEFGCLDIMGKATGRSVAELLGHRRPPPRLPVAAYCFFRLPDQDGKGAVTPDNFVSSVVDQAGQGNFDTVKLKLGVYDPETEMECLAGVRTALPKAKLRIDPNGAWSTATAARLLKRLEDLDLEYVEDPIKDSPLGFQQVILGGRSVDVAGLRRIRYSSTVPLCADNCYRKDLLRSVIQGEAADVVLADVFGCGGIRGTVDWYRTADLFHLGLGMHSGTELGIGHAAKIQAIAAVGDRILHAMDAIYPEYAGDIITGGPFVISDGANDFPSSPGLGVTLDEESLSRYELTAERHRELNLWWEECKQQANVGAASSSMLTRGY